jgi:hypothetical protein
MSCPPSEAGVGSMENNRAKLFGCFSPRVGVSSLSLSDVLSILSIVEGETIVAAVDLVLQILPELGELCVSPSLLHMKVGSPTTLSIGAFSSL